MPRLELASIFIGVTFLALGAASLVAASLRLRRGSIALLTFGLWCSLYGARMLALQPLVSATLGLSPSQSRHFAAGVTYAINIPITLFVASQIGEGWRQSVQLVLVAVTAFALIGLVADYVTGIPGAESGPNALLVLAIVAVGLVNIVYSATRRGVHTPLTD